MTITTVIALFLIFLCLKMTGVWPQSFRTISNVLRALYTRIYHPKVNTNPDVSSSLIPPPDTKFKDQPMESYKTLRAEKKILLDNQSKELDMQRNDKSFMKGLELPELIEVKRTHNLEVPSISHLYVPSLEISQKAPTKHHEDFHDINTGNINNISVSNLPAPEPLSVDSIKTEVSASEVSDIEPLEMEIPSVNTFSSCNPNASTQDSMHDIIRNSENQSTDPEFDSLYEKRSDLKKSGMGSMDSYYTNSSASDHKSDQAIFFEKDPLDNNQSVAFITKDKSLELKNKGKDSFMASRFDEAILFYSESLKYIPNEDPELRSIIFSNMACCYLKLSKWNQVIEKCNLAIKFNKKNLKAYIHRLSANESLQNWNEAIMDIDEILELQPALKSQYHYKQVQIKKLAQEKQEKQKEQAIDQLKDIGKSLLSNFGLTFDDFSVTNNQGSYSIQYNKQGNRMS